MPVGLGLASVLWFQLLKLGPLTPRLVWGGVAFVGAAAVVASLALTPWLNLVPCHLCVFQRLLFMVIAVLALIAVVPANVRGRWLPAVLTLAVAALGLAVAGYQSWLQFQPANTLSCSAGQLSRIDDLVEWLGQQVPTLFLAGGSSDETQWLVLGLSLANWAMIAFAGGLAVGGWALVHEYRAQRLPSVGPRDRRIAERRTHDRRAHTG
ncbi:disulfide bond formation protein B [Candidatus Thiodictyon syntrophicum]|uniref:disulfide bond formation protein B n=1 Tax=Candidatus Thiodictyon syntrophicum TaxID=1166950 RepID=UPI001C12AACF|nr:disulfide bond formation protein B [Candidatus Thiodictyon syntrophicum]